MFEVGWQSSVVVQFGGARLPTSRLARTLAPPNIETVPLPKVQADMSAAIAAVLEQFEAPLMLRELPLPVRMQPGAALVRTEMAGICGTDVHLWKGQLPIALPVILGHETVGRLEQLGDGLERD